MKRLTKKTKRKLIKNRSKFINYRLKHTKFRLKDIVKFLYNDEIYVGVITEISFVFKKPCYTINSLDFKKCFNVYSENIISKIKRYHHKLKRVKHLFKPHTCANIKISKEFINDYCNFYEKDISEFIKELNDSFIFIDSSHEIDILNFYKCSKSYDVYLRDHLILHEDIITKFLL